MAVYIVKPEAIERRAEISQYIEEHSYLNVEHSALTTLDEEALHYLFIDDRATHLLKAIREHMVGKTVEVNVVSADSRQESDISHELVRVTGSHFDPSLCVSNSVRAIFGSTAFKMYGDQKYFLNAVHRTGPNESEEATAWAKTAYFSKEDPK